MQGYGAAELRAWRSQLKKGSLELAVLLVLRRKPSYGVELVDTLNTARLEVSDGSIYPLLARLRAEKKVVTEWIDEGVGHARKYYQLTVHGRRVLEGMLAAWHDHTAAFDRLVGPLP